MRNWLIAVAAGSALIGILTTASAQEVQRAGGGAASVACAFAAGGGSVSCLGSGTSLQSFATPDGSASVSDNVTITGMSGGSQVSMSAISIQVSGNASFTPPSGCDSGSVGGQGPAYFANGSQSVYADVPNGTPIRITINASASGTGGGGASWSDAKSGAGGVSGTTVFDAAAGPGKITASGVDYYLIDTISANGAAGARFTCDAANSQSFSASLGLSFCVAAGKMKAASSAGLTALVNTPVELKVQVNNGCTNVPLSGQPISFSAVSVPAGGENFSLPASAQTDANGFAAVSFTPGSAPGVYSVSAFCPACGADRQVVFTVTALTNEQARLLIKLSGDDTGIIGTRLENPLRVRMINSVTGESEVGIPIDFNRENPASCPPGTSVSPTRTATDGSGIAKAFVVLGLIPGSCQIRASCATCPNSLSVYFSVQGILPPDINITNGSDGPSRTGGGPSPSGGDGDSSGSGPLKIEYGIGGRGYRLTRPPDAGFVGVLTGDAVTFRAAPPEGSFQWSGAGASGTGQEATVTFNQEHSLVSPALVTLTRTGDGKTESASILSDLRPSGVGMAGALFEATNQLCGDSGSLAKCAFIGAAHPFSYLWAEENFEPNGRRAGSCHNNCCDAGKHTMWHALATRFIGPEFSQLFSVAHEKDGLDAGDPHNEIVMDLNNNRLGQNIGFNSQGIVDTAQIGRTVLQRIQQGDALVLYDPRNAEGLSILERSGRCGR